MWIWNNSLAGVHSIRAQGGFIYLVYFIFLKLTAVVGKIDLKTGLNKCLVFCCIYGRRVASMNPEWKKAFIPMSVMNCFAKDYSLPMHTKLTFFRD